MPIKIPDNLPSRAILELERVPLILEQRALKQDIRPLQIAILNLMPNKIATETQLLRAIGLSPLQIEITLFYTVSYQSKNTSQEHLTTFYQTFSDIKRRKFDALIITGAPVEHLDYKDVAYWSELTDILDWARNSVYSTMFLCWGALAALYYYHGVEKSILPQKLVGIYPQRVLRPFSPLTAGFDDLFDAPVSRYTGIMPEEVLKNPELEILVSSEESGTFIIHDDNARRVYILNHLEYDAETIQKEYERDTLAGLNPQIPYNYFPNNNPKIAPRITWRAHRTLLFSNWINDVYQGTPYDLESISSIDKIKSKEALSV